ISMRLGRSNNINGPQRRRSARLSPRQADLTTDNKMARPGFAVKRSITVKKIAPRKTTAPSEHNKENTPRRSGSESVQQKKPKVSTPSPVPENRGSSSSKKKQKPDVDPADAVWSQKVRRSYSRLSDKSFNSPESRETLFGFEKLNTPVVSGFLSGLSSFTSLLEADDCASAFPEPDPNIPGVAVVKEKRRRKKVQQIDNAELDQLAAKMNAEFEEAEGFELIVE
uniref:Cell division cycle associated 5 n=1 Tax=Sphaeramia orbicularis TaxID=375764 RepID=A0A673B0W7_9TELE